MDASMMSQMKSIEDENRRLKRMLADLIMQAELLKEALGKNDAASSTPGAGREGCGFISETIDRAQDIATDWLWTSNNERPNMAVGGVTLVRKPKMAA